jgi:hypothetical protein
LGMHILACTSGPIFAVKAIPPELEAPKPH